MKAVPVFFLGVLLLYVGSLRAAERPEDEPVVRVVQKLRPAVVNIYTERLEERRVVDPADVFFERFFGGGVAGGGRVVPVPVRSLGSGVIISADGYIVTNQHVVERASEGEIKVTLSDKSSFSASLVREDPDLDLALLRVKGDKPFAFLDATRISPNLLGQTVVAIGNPVGYESSVSLGILSAKDRNLTIGDFTYDALLQTDAAINPGNSGGPLVDVAGQFVGLNTAKMAASLVGGSNVPVEKIGFAIPAERVKAFVQDAIEIVEGRKPAPPEISLVDQARARLGLHLQEVDQDLGREFGIRPGSGLLIVKVEAGSPAENVGIEQGMVLIGLGSSRLRSPEDLPRSLLRLKKGDKIKATLLVFQRRGTLLMQRTAAVELEIRN